MLDRLNHALQGHGNVLVAGGTGSGKTTLLNALIQKFPPDDRILVVEDTLELHVTQSNTVRLEARDLDTFQLSARDMVKHALRHRPDHIVIGEIRGDEAQDVLQALNTGHGGSLTTIHANTARDALTRVACCAKQAADDYPWDIICQLVAMAFNLVVHQRRLPGGTRGVSELIEVKGYDRNKAEFVTETLWERPAAHVPAEALRRASGCPPGGARGFVGRLAGAASSCGVRCRSRGASASGGRGSRSQRLGRARLPAGAIPAQLNGAPAGAPDPGESSPDVSPSEVPSSRGAGGAGRVRASSRSRSLDAKPMTVRGWARRKVLKLSDVPQASGIRPDGQPVRFVVRRPQWTVPRDFVLEQKPTASPASPPVEEDRAETRTR